MTRWDVCNRHLAQFAHSRFLEIGTKYGYGATKIQADVKVGVDPHPMGGCSLYTYFSGETSDKFFSDLAPMHAYHVVLIDGLHHVDQVLRDVNNSLAHLEPNGLIVVHDCNPPDEASQIVPRPTGQVHWNGDVWKAIVYLRSSRSDLSVMTIDADEGLGLIQRYPRGISRDDLLVTPKEVRDLTFHDLQAHREEWLNLVPA